MKRGLRWPRAAVLATTATALLASGCANPYHFSKQLNTRLQSGPAGAVQNEGRLAGDLDLALVALMDQRRLLWEAAGETEHMKNATALGLIGLGAVGIYRGLRGEESKAWLQRAGLVAGATFVGASWLEPDARQKIYLQGAMSLTCLALVTSAYEMPLQDYETIREAVDKARHGLEQLASALRLAGRYDKYSEDWWLVRNGWNKLRWAQDVLNNADKALGNIERTGPRLRDETALLSSEVARQVNLVSRDLGKLPDAIARIKPTATALLGADFSAPKSKDEVNKPAPDQPEDDGLDKSAGGNDGAECKPAAASKDGAKAPAADSEPEKQARAAAASAKQAAASAKRADAAASAAADKARQAADSARAAKASATASAQAAAPTAPAASAAAYAAPSVRERLAAAMQRLDEPLGKVASFVQRTAAARAGLKLPPGCGVDLPMLLPATRSVVLRPDEQFQFVMTGDSGRLSVEALGAALPRDVLDLSMPVVGADAALRLVAGRDVKRTVNTVLRISDSKGRTSYEVDVKVCQGKPPA